MFVVSDFFVSRFNDAGSGHIRYTNCSCPVTAVFRSNVYVLSMSINVNHEFLAWLKQPNCCEVHDSVVRKFKLRCPEMTGAACRGMCGV